jgi:hypothetical protein
MTGKSSFELKAKACIVSTGYQLLTGFASRVYVSLLKTPIS